MLVPAFKQPPARLARRSALALADSTTTLSKFLKGKHKKITAQPEWTCAACRKGNHSACVSSRCACGKKEGHK